MLLNKLLLVLLGCQAEAMAYGLESLTEYPDPEDAAATSGDLEMAPQVKAAVLFTFKSTLTTNQAQLFLGDLADCSGSATICAEAYGIDLGPSPEPGRQMQWKADHVREVLAKEWPRAHIEIRAPKTIKITAGSASVDERRILADLQRELARAPDSLVQASAEHVTQLAPIKVRPGEVELSFPELTEQHLQDEAWVRKHLSGIQRLTVACRSLDAGPDEAAQHFVVSVQFVAREQRLVAAQNLSKGTVLTAEQLQMQWLPATRGGSNSPRLHAEAAVGQRLKREVNSGSPLSLSDIEMTRLIKRGQIVTLQMQRGDLQVSSQVKVLADASAGQTIEAVYPSTKKKLRVLAVDAQTVQLLK